MAWYNNRQEYVAKQEAFCQDKTVEAVEWFDCVSAHFDAVGDETEAAKYRSARDAFIVENARHTAEHMQRIRAARWKDGQ
jgi:hypothetical protein